MKMDEELKEMKNKVDSRVKETINGLFWKAQELRDERSEIIKTRKAKLTSLKRKFDTRITRLTLDIGRFEESAKILVGSRKYYVLKTGFLAELKKKKLAEKTLNKETEKKEVEKKDPILLEAEKRNL